MLNLSDALSICSFLESSCFFVGRGNETGIAGCVWVKNPYIEICILGARPKTISTDINMSMLYSDS